MVEAISPLRVLTACGWLPRGDASDPRVRIESLTRSHRVAHVTAPDGRRVIVKQPMHDVRRGRDLSRELFVYRLATWIPALSNVLPATLHVDEHRQVLVIESLANGRWPDEIETVPITSAGIACQLGRAMAGWHRATLNVPMATSLASGILHLPDALPLAIEGRSDSGRTFMASTAADPELAAALREGAAIYRPACLIHGDIRPENWLLRRSGTQPTLAMIDWEMSGLGDPAWDLASGCAECILQAVRTSMTRTDDGDGWPVVVEAAVRELVAAYANVEGAPLREPSDWARVVLFAVARLLHVATEWAEYPHNVDDGLVDALTQHAQRLWRARVQAANTLNAWAVS